MGKQRPRKVQCLIKELTGSLLQSCKPNNCNPDTPTFGAAHYYYYSALHLKTLLPLLLSVDSTLSVTQPSVTLQTALDSHVLLNTLEPAFLSCLHRQFLSKVLSYINIWNSLPLLLTKAISHNQYFSRKHCSRNCFCKPFALSLSSVHWFPFILCYKHKPLS